MGEADIADVVSPEDDLSGLPCWLQVSSLQSNVILDLILVHSVQFVDSFKSFLFPYPIPDTKHPPAPLGYLMFAGYYVWDMQKMRSSTHAKSSSHSQSNVEITSCLKEQAAQSSEGDEFIPVQEKRKSVPVKTFSADPYAEEEVLDFIG